MNEQAIKEAIKEYVDRKIQDHLRIVIIEASENLRKRMEKEALEISFHVAQMYRVNENSECITISVVKKI